MAKRIKAVQCPQCGSVQQTRIDKEHYKCESCATEYFIDSDDINVNVRHQYKYETQSPTTPNKGVVKAITIGGIIFALFIIISFVINISTDTDDVLGPASANVNNYIEGATLPYASQKAISFYITKRTYGKSTDNDSRNGYYAVFYDLENKKKLKDSKLDIPNIKVTGSAYASRYFSSMDKSFGIINKSRILDINFEQMSVKDVTIEILSNHKEFESGTATIEFTYEYRGDGFRIMTNMGENLTYYPSLDLVQKKDDKSVETKQAPIEKTFYTFTEKSRDYPNLPIQLLQITYLYNNGGPESKPNYLSWSKDYLSKKTDGEYGRYLIRDSNKEVKHFEDFTPERIYFNPKVLYQTDKELLIKFNPSMAPDAPTSFQLLNLETKEPVWTKQTPKDIYISNVCLTDKYFIILEHSNKYHFLPLGNGDIEYFEMPRR